MRGSSVTATGRPILQRFARVNRSNPLRSGMYSCGPSPSLRSPALVSTQTSAPAPRTHMTALFLVVHSPKELRPCLVRFPGAAHKVRRGRAILLAFQGQQPPLFQLPAGQLAVDVGPPLLLAGLGVLSR